MKRSKKTERKLDDAVRCLSSNARRTVRTIERQVGAIKSGLEQHHASFISIEGKMQIWEREVLARQAEHANVERQIIQEVSVELRKFDARMKLVEELKESVEHLGTEVQDLAQESESPQPSQQRTKETTTRRRATPPRRRCGRAAWSMQARARATRRFRRTSPC